MLKMSNFFEKVQKNRKCLIVVAGDVLISSGVIAYLGAFTSAFRSECSREWSKKCQARHTHTLIHSDTHPLTDTLYSQTPSSLFFS